MYSYHTRPNYSIANYSPFPTVAVTLQNRKGLLVKKKAKRRKKDMEFYVPSDDLDIIAPTTYPQLRLIIKALKVTPVDPA